MTESIKHRPEEIIDQSPADKINKGLCDSCNFSVDSRLSYQTILKFCELHMKNNPGHKAKPYEK